MTGIGKHPAWEELGGRLEQYRVTQQLTRREVAEQVGVAPITLYRYERGFHGISLAMLVRLCRLLGCSVDQVIRGIQFPEGAGIPKRE